MNSDSYSPFQRINKTLGILLVTKNIINENKTFTMCHMMHYDDSHLVTYFGLDLPFHFSNETSDRT